MGSAGAAWRGGRPIRLVVCAKQVVNYLFSYRPGGSADPDRQDSEGETALHKAAKKGRLEVRRTCHCCYRLVGAGRCDTGMAAWWQVVELLLKHHAGVSIKDDQGNTAAHYAAKNPAVLELICACRLRARSREARRACHDPRACAAFAPVVQWAT